MSGGLQWFYMQPGHRLGDALDFCYTEYSREFREYWGLEKDGPPDDIELDTWIHYIQLAAAAKRLAQDASRLIRPSGVSPDEWGLPDVLKENASKHQQRIDKILEEIRTEHGEDVWAEIRKLTTPEVLEDPRVELSFFQDAFELEVADLYLPDISTFSARVLGLLQHAARYRGTRSVWYLERVASCYVRDMPPEMAVMGRAVIETAIRERISDADVIDRLGFGKSGHLGLERRIDYLDGKQLIPAEATEAAHLIRKAGDAAAHGELEEVPSCNLLLAALVHVQDALSSLPLRDFP